MSQVGRRRQLQVKAAILSDDQDGEVPKKGKGKGRGRGRGKGRGKGKHEASKEKEKDTSKDTEGTPEDATNDPPKRKTPRTKAKAAPKVKADTSKPSGASKPPQRKRKAADMSELGAQLEAERDLAKAQAAEVSNGAPGEGKVTNPPKVRKPRNPQGAVTFARRYKPTSSFGAAKWDAIRNTFIDDLRPALPRAYTHEA